MCKITIEFFKNRLTFRAHGDILKPSKERRIKKCSNFLRKTEKLKKVTVLFFAIPIAIDTAFGVYGTYNTYEKADHIIRMTWNKTKEQKIDNGYKVKDAWIVIKKN